MDNAPFYVGQKVVCVDPRLWDERLQPITTDAPQTDCFWPGRCAYRGCNIHHHL